MVDFFYGGFHGGGTSCFMFTMVYKHYIYIYTVHIFSILLDDVSAELRKGFRDTTSGATDANTGATFSLRVKTSLGQTADIYHSCKK